MIEQHETNVSSTAMKAIDRLQLRQRETCGGYLTLGNWLHGLSPFDVIELNELAAKINPDVEVATDLHGRDFLVITMLLLSAEGEDVESLTTEYVNDAMVFLTGTLLPLEELRRANLVSVNYMTLSFAQRDTIVLTELVAA